MQLTSSYILIFSRSTPSNCSPSQRTAAVIPLPQLVITGTFRLNTRLALSAPKALITASPSCCVGSRVVYTVPFGAVLLCRNVLKGRDSEFGMWPDESPALGSGSVPRYLAIVLDISSGWWRCVTHLPDPRASSTSSASGSREGTRVELDTICS